MVELVVQHLTKAFGLLKAVDDVSFTVADGEFLTLLGPSGCGKSTTLAAVAGLDVPTGGLIRAGDRVFFDGSTGKNLPTEERNCGLVFQSYALWPHMTVRANVAFPLALRRVSGAEQRRRIDEALALVEMSPYADRYPHQLSGGQQQRVALARTLVYGPTVLLLDEPLSNLDSKLRDRARHWLTELHRNVRITTIYVTHDQTEALAMSDRIVVMNKGRIVQVGPPRDIYEAPVDPFVADFIGTSSFLRGELKAVSAEGTEATIRLGSGPTIRAALSRQIAPGAQVTVAVRPERLQLMRRADGPGGEVGTCLTARIASRSYFGARWQYQLEVDASVLKVETAEEFDDPDVTIWVPAAGCVVFESKDEPSGVPA
jgi:iron(III) transport system ATP-binding protein